MSNRSSAKLRTGAEEIAERQQPAEQPAILLCAINEIIIALRRFRERLKRLATEQKKS
jgi:hypothetical protein